MRNSCILQAKKFNKFPQFVSASLYLGQERKTLIFLSYQQSNGGKPGKTVEKSDWTTSLPALFHTYLVV